MLLPFCALVVSVLFSSTISPFCIMLLFAKGHSECFEWPYGPHNRSEMSCVPIYSNTLILVVVVVMVVLAV